MKSEINERTKSLIIAMCKDKYKWKGSLFKTIDQSDDIQSFLIRLYLSECEPQDSYSHELDNVVFFVHQVFDGEFECKKGEIKRIAHELVGAWHEVRVPEYSTARFKSFPILKMRNTKYGVFDEITTYKLFPSLFIIIPLIISACIVANNDRPAFLFLCGGVIFFWLVLLVVVLTNLKSFFPFIYNVVCGLVYYFGLDGLIFAGAIDVPSCAYPLFVSALLSLLFANRFQGVFLGTRQWKANIYRPLEEEFSSY